MLAASLSVAQALRTFAEATRTKRRQVAEEKAAKETSPTTAAPASEAKTYPLPDAEPGTEPPGT